MHAFAIKVVYFLSAVQGRSMMLLLLQPLRLGLGTDPETCFYLSISTLVSTTNPVWESMGLYVTEVTQQTVRHIVMDRNDDMV